MFFTHISKLPVKAHCPPQKLKANYTNYLFRDYITNFSTNVFQLFSNLLLLISGDIESNPGPDQAGDLRVMHVNVRSLIKNIDLLAAESHQYDIITISETWIQSIRLIDETKLEIPGFHSLAKLDRQDGYGGVAIYVRSNLVCKPRPDLQVDGLEAVWIETKFNKQSLLVGCFYRSPDKRLAYWDLVEESIRKANNTTIKFIVLGDFNADWLGNPPKRYLDIINLYQLTQLINEPTRITTTTKTCIDHILVQSCNLINFVKVLPPFCSDHSVPCVNIIKTKPNNYSFKRNIFIYSKLNKERFLSLLQEIDWLKIFLVDDINVSAETFTDIFFSIAKQCMPTKTVKVRSNDTPWMTDELRCSIVKRNKMYKKAKLSAKAEDWEHFRVYRNELTNKIRLRKIEYLNDLNGKVSDPLLFGNKQWWKLVNKFLNRKGVNNDEIPPISYNGKTYYSNKEKASALNDFFVDQCTLPGNDDPLPHIDFKHTEFTEMVLTVEEVMKEIKVLKQNKAVGPDQIHNKLLVAAADIIADPLTKFFNRCLDNSIFPKIWKTAYVTPIYKKGNRDECTNYRPVSLLSCVGKLFERCVHVHMNTFFTQNKLIISAQSGFIKGDSTTSQLLSIYNDIVSNYDKGITTQSIFFDLSKAFDRVWHRGLLLKLEAIGIRGKFLKFVHNYLTDRYQAVVVKGEKSGLKAVPGGVPQGSVLGPLLFLVYINDIVQNIVSSIKLFADDTSISHGNINANIRQEVLNSDLLKIEEWAKLWKLTFNENKTELLNFRRGNEPIYDLKFANTILFNTESHNHLGLIIQENCKWGEHINCIAKKTNMLISFLRSYKYSLCRKSLEIMYKSFILPIFDYADIIWDSCTDGQSDILEKIHLEAIRIITGSVKGTCHQKLYEESGFTSLKNRRRTHRLIFYYKMVNGLCPDYLLNILPPFVSTINPYHRRRPNERLIPSSKTDIFQRSFIPQTTADWNSLPDHIKTTDSISVFKRFLKSVVNAVPAFYYLGDRPEQIIHCRLRLGMSNLNYDLFNRHLTADPSCACGFKFETAEHYFLYCPKYSYLRQSTISKIKIPDFITLDISLLLSGNLLLPARENSDIVLVVHTFIKNSRRFQ